MAATLALQPSCLRGFDYDPAWPVRHEDELRIYDGPPIECEAPQPPRLSRAAVRETLREILRTWRGTNTRQSDAAIAEDSAFVHRDLEVIASDQAVYLHTRRGGFIFRQCGQRLLVDRIEDIWVARWIASFEPTIKVRQCHNPACDAAGTGARRP